LRLRPGAIARVPNPQPDPDIEFSDRINAESAQLVADLRQTDAPWNPKLKFGIVLAGRRPALLDPVCTQVCVSEKEKMYVSMYFQGIANQNFSKFEANAVK
jgi:hypothetical protein